MNDDENGCQRCNGTGEGMHDGQICLACRGIGIENGDSDDDNFDGPYSNEF